MPVVCSMCNFECPSAQLLLNHLRTVHVNDPHFTTNCVIDCCSYTAKTFSALYSHVYRQHKELIRPQSMCPSRLIIDHCHEPDEAQNADMEHVIMSLSTTPIIGIHILFVIIPSLSVPCDFSLTLSFSLARLLLVCGYGWVDACLYVVIKPH